MKRTTSQWRSVSSGMPFCAAIACGDLLVPLRRVGEEAFGVDVDGGIGDQGHRHVVLLFSGVDGRALLAGGRHRRPERREARGPGAARASRPTGTASLPRWLSRDSRSSGEAERGREVARQRLGLVVEVDQQRLVEAGLDEAVGVAVVARARAPGRRGSGRRSRLSTSASKCVTEPAFEVGRSVASPSANTFGFAVRLQRALVGRDEAERVAEAAASARRRRRRRAAGTVTSRSKSSSRPS